MYLKKVKFDNFFNILLIKNFFFYIYFLLFNHNSKIIFTQLEKERLDTSRIAIK